MFQDVDVSSWSVEHVEQVGRKRKMWLLDPEGDAWLFKQTTENAHADGARFWKGDDWAEVVVAAVAEEMGIPTAVYRLAHLDESEIAVPGVISHMMVSGDESLIEGNVLLEEIGVRAASARDRAGYTLENVRRALNDVAPTADDRGMTSWEWFVGYLVLDALVGNSDRHQQNWAVIQDSSRRLAPTFDHASSLGFLLDDDTRLARLTTKDSGYGVEAFAARASTKFEGNPSTLLLAQAALQMVPAVVRGHWVERAGRIESLDPILARLPTSRMSEPAKAFAAAVFGANRTQLCGTP